MAESLEALALEMRRLQKAYFAAPKYTRAKDELRIECQKAEKEVDSALASDSPLVRIVYECRAAQIKAFQSRMKAPFVASARKAEKALDEALKPDDGQGELF
jgi:hypothetical protein